MPVPEPVSVQDQSPQATTAAPSALEAAEERFIEAMGLAHEEDRLPRIAGRIVGLLIVSPEPVRFDQLAERLQVSRGSISTNTRLLENMAVIQRVTRPGDRRDYFQITEEPGLLLRMVDRYRSRQAIAEDMRQALAGGDGNDAGELDVVARRLDGFIHFYAVLAESVASVLAAFASAAHPTGPPPKTSANGGR